MIEDRSIPINPMSISSILLEMRCNDQIIGPATGFFFESNAERFLVTNWHVLSGRNPTTRRAIHSSLAVPDSLRLYCHNIRGLNEPIPTDVSLADVSDAPKWLHHPVHGSSLDVAVLPLPGIDRNLSFSIQEAVDLVDPHGDQPIEVADTLFIIGFPLGKFSLQHWPIWKAATVASEPLMDIRELPRFLVDTASRPGMSGSPVFAHTRRAVRTNGFTHHARFVGVYSGRYGARDELQLQLGEVWRADCVQEIIDAAVRADV